MTVPTWLIPLIAGVAAIAVGVAAALFAVRFAAPETTTVTPTTLDAPVLAPVAASPTLEELVETEGDDIPISGTYGIETVIDPDSVPDGALPADFADLIREIETAEDPADVLPEIETADGPMGDPCADTEDPEALGCPPGTPGTIHALGGEMPALQVRANGGNSADCPAPEIGSVRFLGYANVPVTIDVRYSQGDAENFPLETTPAQIADWEARSAAAAEGETVWIEFCIEIGGLRTDRSVNVFLDATDLLGRFTRAAVTFMVSDGLDVPPTRIHPLGESTVVASAPHLAREAVRMYVLDREVEDSCSYGGVARAASFPTIGSGPTTEVVSDEFLAAYSYEPDYTRRTTATFAVSAATQLIVCVGWFPASDGRPSFERDVPLRVSELPLTSPEVSAPRVVLAEVELFGDVPARSVLMSASTENGQFCGSWTGPEFGSLAPDTVLCDYGALLGRTDAGGSMLLTTEVDVPEGLAVNHVLLDVSLLSCVGGCAGRTRFFDVPLSSFIRPTRICSDDCRINVGESVGIARLQVTWPATATGEGWLRGDWYEGRDDVTLPASPRLDTTGDFEVRASDLHPRAFQAFARLRADRPVRASADIIGYPGEGVTCPWPGGSTRWEGGAVASSTFTVLFEGLCAGTGYVVELTLTDPATGERTAYSITHPGGITDFTWWIDAQFVTPTIPTNVPITSATFDLGDPTRLIRPSDFDVYLGSTEYSFAVPREGLQNCWFGGIPNRTSRVLAVAAGETVTIRVEVRFRPGSDPGRTDTADGRPTFCDVAGTWRDEERVTFAGTVTYEQLIAGPTVTLTDPETGYTVSLVLAAS